MLPILALTTGCLPKPAAPITLACATAPSIVFPGDRVTVTGSTQNFNPEKATRWNWTSTVSHIDFNGNLATLGTESLSSGTYSVHGQASQGPKPGQSAECTATFTIKEFEPPVIACAANPTTIRPGETSTISASGVSPQNLHLTYDYRASAGTIVGNGPTATFDSTGAPQGAVTVTCSVADDKGQRADASTSVSIYAPSAPPPPEAPNFSCLAKPSSVRPGDPVVLSVSPHRSGDSVVWSAAAGVLDAGIDTSVIDTKNLNPRTVAVRAQISNLGRPIGACETAFTVNPNAAVAPWPTLNIVREPLQQGQKENTGFAVYTYVLFRRHPITADEITRFKNVLAAIAAHPAPEEYGQSSLAPGTPGAPSIPSIAAQNATSRRELAAIIVPVTGVGPFTSDWLLQNYNPAFASQLLSNLNCQRATDRMNCSRRLSGDGPFLISTVVRLSGHPEGFLVQDISRTTPEVGGDWVAAYMSMVTAKENWVNGFTLQKAKLTFASSLDSIGGALQNAAPNVKAAIAFFKLN